MQQPTTRRRLRTKIIAWSLFPTAIILSLVALVTFMAYDRTTQMLVIERDEKLTRLSATQLANGLSSFTDELHSLARSGDMAGGEQFVQIQALRRASNRLVVFDGGVILLNRFGQVISSEPPRPEIVGQDWSSRQYYRDILRTQRAVFSNVGSDGPDGATAIVAAVPILGSQGEFVGTLVGQFLLGPKSVSAFYGTIVKLRMGESDRLYLVDAAGRVIYHYDHQQIGRDLSREGVTPLLLKGETGAKRTTDFSGASIVAGYSPVPGTPWGLVTEERWDIIGAAGGRYRAFLIGLLIVGTLMPVLIALAGASRITRPVDDLIAAAQEVAEGRFDQAIGATSGDEIEELALQFNRMSARLRASYTEMERQVEDRTRALAALNSVAAATTRTGDLDEALSAVLPEALDAIGVEAGAIFVRGPEDDSPRLVAAKGLSADAEAAAAELGLGESFANRAIDLCHPVAVCACGKPKSDEACAELKGVFSGMASVPLESGGRPHGALVAATRTQRVLTAQEEELLVSIGRQIGVAIEKAQLMEKVGEVAAAEERQRLARELHDAVTQTLFSASLIAEVLPRLWERRPEEARARLEELRQLSRGALAEMRTLLMELRPAALAEAKFTDLLRQLSEAFTGRSRIPVELRMVGECNLAPDVKVALYRIAQEALNNAVKHAGAQHVWISLEIPETGLALEVRDDGQGFDPGLVSPEHLGLGIMRERAASIGASLTVDSQVGAGATVRVVLPF